VGGSRAPLWPALLIVAAGCIAYGGSFDGAFVLDDDRYIAENDRIRQLWPLTGVLSHRRPVLDLSLAINYAVGGVDVTGYHAVNLAIHLLASLALYGVVRRSLESIAAPPMAFGAERGPPQSSIASATAGKLGRAASPVALVVALVWCVHPLQTQSVTYLIQRSESMMGLFYLLTLYALIRGATSRQGLGWYCVCVACCALGMGTKAVMVTAPIALLLYDRAFLTRSWAQTVRRRWGLYLALAATWSVLWAAGVAKGVLDPSRKTATVGFSFREVSPVQYLVTQAGVLVAYLKLSLWPRPLCLDYGWPVARTAAAIAVPGVIVVTLLVGTVWIWFRRPRLGFLGAWFFLVLAPTSSIVPIRDPLFEHRMYLPLASVVVLAVIGVYALLGALRARRWGSARAVTALAVAVVVVAVTVFAGGTIRRNRDYRSDLDMWQDIVAKRPKNVRAWYNVGTGLLDENRLEEAAAALRSSLRVNPRDTRTLDESARQAHYNLGKVLSRQGRTSAAAEAYQEALRIDPAMAEAHSDLGNILARAGRYEEALERYRQAVDANPHYIPAYFNYASVLLQLDRAQEAVDLLNQAIEVSPETARLHYLLGTAYQRLGESGAALDAFDRTLELAPGDARARAARNAVLQGQGGPGGTP
jgi:tetratricopeptide (TPR) repeat protein